MLGLDPSFPDQLACPRRDISRLYIYRNNEKSFDDGYPPEWLAAFLVRRGVRFDYVPKKTENGYIQSQLFRVYSVLLYV